MDILTSRFKGMDGRMLGIESAEQWQKAVVELLDEPFADTDGVDTLSLKVV